jgi:starch synthase (maltosyl-transferring)
MTELATVDADYFRPNFFVNTPDILTGYLVDGGRPAFEARLVLAATLSPSYGVYSGYENVENVPVRPGSEEYLDSEKYETKERAIDGPLLPLIAKLNEIRRANRSLQRIDNVTFLETANDNLIAYEKQDEADRIIVCVNLDPTAPEEGLLDVPASPDRPPSFVVQDLLTDETYAWQVGGNYVRLPPGGAHVMHVR